MSPTRKTTKPAARPMASPMLRGVISTEELAWIDPAVDKPVTGKTVALWSAAFGFLAGWWDVDDEVWRDNAHGGIVTDVVAWSDPAGPTP